MTLLDKWEEIRLKGKKDFIWKYGVLFLGFMIGVPVSVVGYFTNHGSSPTLEGALQVFLISLIVFLLIGYLFGVFTWHYCEKRYRKKQKGNLH